MKRDIKTRKHIDKIIKNFYDKVKKDEKLSHFFEDIAKINWETHLPKMCGFLENVLFFTGDYSGSPMEVHKALKEKTEINSAHFQHWNHLFDETVDDYYAGKNTKLIKQRFLNISEMMMDNIV